MMSLKTLGVSAAAIALLCAIPAAASAGVYVQNFDSGSAPGFTMGGMWHVTSNFPSSPNYALGYVQGETAFSGSPDGNYDTAGSPNSGAAFSPLIALSSVGTPTLTLNAVNFNEIGDSPDYYDRLEIGVSLDGSTFDSLLASTSHYDGAASFFSSSSPGAPYQTLTFDLSAYKGQSIYLMFNYATIDAVDNFHPGARIDDISITGTAVPEPAT